MALQSINTTINSILTNEIVIGLIIFIFIGIIAYNWAKDNLRWRIE